VAPNDSKKRILLIVLGISVGVVCVCGGGATLVIFKVSSCIGEANVPVETVAQTFDCPGASVAVVNVKTTTNWLEGVSRNDAVLRVTSVGTSTPVDVETSFARYRDFLPQHTRPRHRLDGDPSLTGFELFLDPAVLPDATADAIQQCFEGRRGELTAALRMTETHRWSEQESPEEPVTWWRAPSESLEPIFTAPSGDTLKVQYDGSLWLQTPNVGSMVGRAVRQPDGSLVVDADLSVVWGGYPTPVTDFRNAGGQNLEDFFGVPIGVHFEF